MSGPTKNQLRTMEWARKNRVAFVSRLNIKAKEQQGKVVRFDCPTPGQVKLIETLARPGLRELVILKSRQVHFSTAICAHVWWDTYSRPDPFRTLVATNHTETTGAIFEKYDLFNLNMPRRLREANAFKTNLNDKTLTSTVTGACIDHLTAGGTGGGRGWNYQRFVAEECAFWPRAEKAYAAITSAVDDDSQTIIISTPNGPRNLYHDKCLRARKAQANGEEGVEFLFLPWFEHPKYSMAVPNGWEPTQDEWLVQRKFQLTTEQLYWRHWRINGIKGIGEREFMREYPATEEEGFLVTDGGWYNVELLNDILNALPEKAPTQMGGVRIYRKPQPGKYRYAAGVDPSWCNGGDNAVCAIVDEFGRTCAMFSMNRGGDRLFAEEAADLCNAYKAKVLVESNPGGAGRNVLKYFQEAGLNCWKTSDGKFWTTTNGRKQEAYSHHRRMVNGDAFDLADKELVLELMHIREVNSKIEGQDGYHDDHAMAHVLAEWCRKDLPGGRVVVRDKPREYTRDPLSVIQRAIG
jgi:hypothetical protein